jgi:hypothetical protein
LLRQNRDRLRRENVFVPLSKHVGQPEFLLACRSEADGSRFMLKWGVQTTQDLLEIQPALAEKLGAMFEAASAEFDTVIISNEGLARRSPEEIERLRAILAPHCTSFTIVAFLRRQDLLLNSFYKNAVRNAGRVPLAYGENPPDYGEILSAWASVFGRNSVSPLLFPDSAFEPTDLIETFLAACGLADMPLDGFDMPGHRNVAWDARSLILLKAVNNILPPTVGGRIPPERRMIEMALQTALPNSVPFRLPIETAMKICERAKISNLLVAREWFGREDLFNDDFSMYGKEPPEDVTLDDYARVLVTLAGLARKHRARAAYPSGDEGELAQENRAAE